MTGLVIRSPGTCTDRTLPMRNPLWTPSLLAATRVFDLDCDTGYTVDPNSKLTKWVDGAGGRSLTLAAGDGAVRNYAFGTRTAVRFTVDGYYTDAAIDAAVAQRFLWLVIDVIDPGAGSKMIFHTDSLQMYLIGGGTQLQINGLTGGSYVTPITTGKHLIIVSQQVAGTTNVRIDGVASANGPRTNVAGTALSLLRLGNYDPGVVDMAIGALGFGSGTIDLGGVQKLEGYLAARFGQQGLLPAAHPYKAALPRKLA